MSRYATYADLYTLGAPETAFDGLAPEALDGALDAACDTVDSYLANRFTLPLTAVNGDVKRAACIIAAYDLIAGRGWNPSNSGGDSDQLSTRYDKVIEWLRDVAKGLVTPVVTDSAAPTTVVSPGGLPDNVVVAPSLSGDGLSYVVGPPQPRGW